MSKISELVDALFAKLENKKNKIDSITVTDSDKDKEYYLSLYGLKNKFKDFTNQLDEKQNKLVNGQNIRRLIVNGSRKDLLGSGDIEITFGEGFTQKQTDWTVNDDTDVRYIKHKPSLDDFTNLEDVNTLLNDRLRSITKFRVKIVSTLPVEEEAESDVIYFIKKEDELFDEYDEWVIDENKKWIHLGSTKVNLEDYLSKDEWQRLRKYYVHVEEGKSLSSNDFTETHKNNVERIPDIREDIIRIRTESASVENRLQALVLGVKTELEIALNFKADSSDVTNKADEIVTAMEKIDEQSILPPDTRLQGRIKEALKNNFARKDHVHTDVWDELDRKQEKLIDHPIKEGEVQNLKTINGASILGTGDLVIGHYGKLQSDWNEKDETLSSFILNKPNLDIFLNRTEYEYDINQKLTSFKNEVNSNFYDKNSINQYFNGVDTRIQNVYRDLQPKLKSGENISTLTVNGVKYDLTNGGDIKINSVENGDTIKYPID